MKQQINHSLIVLARETRGLTQYELAERMSISPAQLSKMELGAVEVYEEYVDKLSDLLHYPKTFFYQEVQVLQPILSYRKRQVVAQKLLTPIDAQINVFSMHIQYFINSMGFSKPNIPILDIAQYETPQACAKELRKLWKVKEPILENISKLLEDNGIIITSFNFGTERVDSRTIITASGHPVIFTNKTMLGDKLRFSLAYELGHLVMHQFTSPSLDRDVSHEANAFSAEFLMPEKDIKKDFQNGVTVALLGELKKKWKVSMHALLYRACDLGMVTDNQKRYIIQQFNQLKIRRREPQEFDIIKEQPTLLKFIMANHKSKFKTDVSMLIKNLHIEHEEYLNMYS
jgi:Zn-dependent peptidase ImmA (M78 family)